MSIYDSGKFILEYIYSLYTSLSKFGKYFYDLLFSNDYKYSNLNEKLNDTVIPFIPNYNCNCISNCISNSINNSISINNSNYITRVNSSGLIEATPMFSDLSNSWKCSICNNFNSITIAICNDCQIDHAAVPFLHDIINEDQNTSDIKISSPTNIIIREIVNELIDNIIYENEKSITKNDSNSLLSLLSDWDYI